MKTCNECETKIESFSDNSEHRLFVNHLRKVHNMSQEEYDIKYKYNGIRPKCNCGCGNDVKYKKGKFHKYFLDHKNKMPASIETIEKMINTKIENDTFNFYKNRLEITSEELINYYNKFINFEISLGNIARELVLDKRTIKKYWVGLNLIKDKNEFNRTLRKHQGFWSKNIFIPIEKDYDRLMDILPDIYNFIKKYKNKHTLGEAINIFELNHRIKPNFLYKTLGEEYGYDDIDNFVKFHNCSSSEIEFFNVLKYYFGRKIERQFKLEDRYYDFILGDKILIEYDGTYWHSTPHAKENDKYKNKLATDNGYILIRVCESKSKDINTLLKIINIYEKIQIKKN